MATPSVVWFSLYLLFNVGAVVAFGLTFWFVEKKIDGKHHPTRDDMFALNNEDIRTDLLIAFAIGLFAVLVGLYFVQRQLVRNIQQRIWGTSAKFLAICIPGAMNILVVRDSYYQAIHASYAMAFICQLKSYSLVQLNNEQQNADEANNGANDRANNEAGADDDEASDGANNEAQGNNEMQANNEANNEVKDIIALVTAEFFSVLFIAVIEKRYEQAYILTGPLCVGIVALFEYIYGFFRDAIQSAAGAGEGEGDGA